MSTDAPKRRLRAPARRALIEQSALEEFAEHGYDHASMGRIGSAAGVARSVLYDHFPAKRALFDALLEATSGALIAHLREAILSDAPVEDRMRATFDAFFGFAEEQPLAWDVLFAEREPIDPDVASDYRHRRRAVTAMLVEMLAPDARRAGLDQASADARAAFAMQYGGALAAVRWWRAHPDVPRARLVEAAMMTYWTGIGGLRA